MLMNPWLDPENLQTFRSTLAFATAFGSLDGKPSPEATLRRRVQIGIVFVVPDRRAQLPHHEGHAQG
jgi:hypothetical protein